MKLTPLKNVAIISLLLVMTFSLIINSYAAPTSTTSVTMNAFGSIIKTPSEISLTYNSSPVAVNAFVNGNSILSGTSIQIPIGSSANILAGEIQDYSFSHWLINEIEYTSNPLIIDQINENININALYNYNSSPESEMIVGVNMWSGTAVNQFQDRDIPLLNQAGLKYIRIGTGVRDSFVDAALAAGIDVIGTFGTNGLPDLNAFGDYVYNRVLHFKGRVNAWVVFNEANYDGFNGNAQGYTQALQTAYTRAKQADPNVKIITTNFLSTEGGLTFLQQMYNYGAKGYFDILGIDPYCYPEPPTEPNQDPWGHTFWNVPALHDLMVQKGDGDKPVWIIEFGYRTPSTKYPLGHSTVVSETQQATYLIEALELAQTWPWLERFYIYEWMDSADVDLGYWGLLKEDYSAPYELKPAYYAVKEFLIN
ncbi:MAG: hypothetical protein QCH99_08220 [Candidatus Bathyarchaeota archaeon]|nr:hypothetical protein [Candidatus Bathyarchaeum tardum]